jgi:hypothetical protein
MDCANKGKLTNTGGFLGSFASITTVVFYLLVVIAVSTPVWTETDQLGTAGGYCSGNCEGNKASFGIWTYCVSEKISTFDDELHDVCLEWTSMVNTSQTFSGTNSGSGSSVGGGNVEADANERFAYADAKENREFTGFAMLAGVILSVIADIYSEKFAVGTILMFCAGLAAMVSMAAWVEFMRNLKNHPDTADVDVAPGTYIAIIAWAVAWVGAFCYMISCKKPRAGKPQGDSRGRANSSTDI